MEWDVPTWVMDKDKKPREFLECTGYAIYSFLYWVYMKVYDYLKELFK